MVEEIKINNELYTKIIERFKYTQVEISGMLIGKMNGQDRCISTAIFPPQGIQTPTYCEFLGRNILKVRDAIENIKERNSHFSLTRILGWIHTHPNIPVIMSEQDKNTFRTWSSLDSQSIAMIVDPINNRWGAYNSQLQKIEIEKGSNLLPILTHERQLLEQLSQLLEGFLVMNGYSQQQYCIARYL